jgi:hypothetical protein
MKATLQQPIDSSFENIITGNSVWGRFINWCKTQEKNRLGWLAAALTMHGCVLTIINTFVVILTGNQFVFWPFIIGAMGVTLVVNLAAMPTRITIPVFFASILVDLLIIIISIVTGINVS